MTHWALIGLGAHIQSPYIGLQSNKLEVDIEKSSPCYHKYYNADNKLIPLTRTICYDPCSSMASGS